MTPDLDIYRSANMLMQQHGEDAPIHAAMRADAILEKGDLDGYAVWKRRPARPRLSTAIPLRCTACGYACTGSTRRSMPPCGRNVLYCSGSVVNMSGYPSLRPALVPSLALLSATSRVNTATTQTPRECAVIMT